MKLGKPDLGLADVVAEADVLIVEVVDRLDSELDLFTASTLEGLVDEVLPYGCDEGDSRGRL